MAYKVNGVVRLDNFGNADLGIATATEFDGKTSKKSITEQTAGDETNITGADEIVIYDLASDDLLRVTVDEFVVGSGIGTLVTDFTNINVSGTATIPTIKGPTGVVGVLTATLFEGDGSSNLVIGKDALDAVNPGWNNVAVGASAGRAYDCTNSVMVGPMAGITNEGNFTTMVGYRAGASNKAFFNTFVGKRAGENVTTGDGNTFIGDFAGNGEVVDVTGKNNTCIGRSAGQSIGAGSSNTLLGRAAGAAVTSGDFNTYVGEFAGGLSTTANNNVAIGYAAGYAARDAFDNVTVGNFAGFDFRQSGNSAFGARAGQNFQFGIRNVFIGRKCGFALTGGDNNLIIGYEHSPSAATQSGTYATQLMSIGYASNTWLSGDANFNVDIPNTLTAGGHTLSSGQLTVAGNISVGGVSTFSGPTNVSQIRTNSFTVLNATGNEALFTASANGPVQLFYDNQLKLSTDTNGVTINGTTTVSGNIVPSANVTYDLGTSSTRFRDLYLSGNTIYLDSNTLSDSSGSLQYNGDDVVLGNSDGNIETNGLIATGIVTANSFSGDGSNLTGITADVPEKLDIQTLNVVGVTTVSENYDFFSVTFEGETRFQPSLITLDLSEHWRLEVTTSVRHAANDVQMDQAYFQYDGSTITGTKPDGRSFVLNGPAPHPDVDVGGTFDIIYVNNGPLMGINIDRTGGGAADAYAVAITVIRHKLRPTP